MRKHFPLTLTLVAAMLFALSASADTTTTAPANPALGNQTHCPVMGGKIDSTSWTDIQGQRVYHCCPGCTKSLQKNPDKYFEEAAAKGIRFENNQTACPVSGKELGDKATFLDHEGRRVFFCCDKCPAKFTADPKQYLSRLDEMTAQASQEKAESSQKAKTGHEGHGH